VGEVQGRRMSNRSTLFVVILAVAGFFALLMVIPGSPLWRIFNPTIKVAFVDPASGDGSTVELKIVARLPRDAIPAIREKDVRFLTGDDAEAQMTPSDRIIGVSIDGDHRAYSIAHLSGHEIVNDTVGGRPIAVTW
jgi:hypothetical protein